MASSCTPDTPDTHNTLASTNDTLALPCAKRRRVNASSNRGEAGSFCSDNDQDDVYTRAVQSELLRYANETTTSSSSRRSYKPSTGTTTTTLSQTQLRAAVLEFWKRCDKGEDVGGLLVVARNLSVGKSPSRQFEIKAPAGTGIAKLWYAMTKANDLVIRKISLGDAHSKSVVRLIGDLVAFSDQYGGILFDVDSDGDHVLLSGTTVAPDAYLQRIYPEQPPAVNTNPPPRAPLVVELEIGNRGPQGFDGTAEPLLAATGIGLRTRNQNLQSNGTPRHRWKRPFAAIAALWRRRNAALGQQVQFRGVWLFGTRALDPNSVCAFTTAHGNLAPIPQIEHPAPCLNIIIPGADLIQGAVDIYHGTNVPLLPNGNDLVVHLGQIRDICDRRLPL